jgi:hypothetical protein
VLFGHEPSSLLSPPLNAHGVLLGRAGVVFFRLLAISGRTYTAFNRFSTMSITAFTSSKLGCVPCEQARCVRPSSSSEIVLQARWEMSSGRHDDTILRGGYDG